MPRHQPLEGNVYVILAISIVQLTQHSYVYHDLQTVPLVQAQLTTSALAATIATLLLPVTSEFVTVNSMILLLVFLQWSVVLAMGDD